MFPRAYPVTLAKMPSSVAVKILAPSADVANKLCDRLELKVLDIKTIRDGFLLIFNSINDREKLFEVKSIDILKNCDFRPVMSGELKTSRSILLKMSINSFLTPIWKKFSRKLKEKQITWPKFTNSVDQEH